MVGRSSVVVIPRILVFEVEMSEIKLSPTEQVVYNYLAAHHGATTEELKNVLFEYRGNGRPPSRIIQQLKTKLKPHGFVISFTNDMYCLINLNAGVKDDKVGSLL